MRVVLVDPSRTMRLFVRRLLEARDHEVLPFADGAQALDCMRQNSDVAALITSAELDGMSGLELCWETRILAGRDRPIYVILMSSSVDKSLLGEALDSGADDFISKPPVADELYARLRAAERLGGMQRELVRLASVDPLTGLHNRRVFFEMAEEVRAQECRLTAVMLDIDHFKRVNDLYGHDVGDQAIAAVAKVAAAEDAIVGRLGGEEFAMLLRGRSPADGASVAEAFCLAASAANCSANSVFMAVWSSSFALTARSDDQAYPPTMQPIMSAMVAISERTRFFFGFAPSGARLRTS